MVLVLSEALDHPSVRRARIVFGQRPREINSQCSRKIQVSQQAPFARQGVNAGQKLLYSVEVGFSFRRNQLLFPFLSRIMSLLRDAGRVLLVSVARIRRNPASFKSRSFSPGGL